ncbi:MAG: acyl-homoserine-lactone synthase [Rhodanobacter sp.]
MQMIAHGGGPLPAELGSALARYRYRVFVEQLGWDLPVVDGCFERDQFDRSDTIYVIARDEDGSICGCARLLPTTRPYLLQELFPFLLAEPTQPPAQDDVWELSRFTANIGGDAEHGRAEWAIRPMLTMVVRRALQLGVRRLIGVTFLSMERLFRRIGIHAHRAGPARRIDNRMVVACWIDIDAQTLCALGITAQEATEPRA